MKDVKEQKQNDAGTGDKNSKEQRQSMADIIL